jgi:hypothetical protein
MKWDLEDLVKLMTRNEAHKFRARARNFELIPYRINLQSIALEVTILKLKLVTKFNENNIK